MAARKTEELCLAQVALHIGQAEKRIQRQQECVTRLECTEYSTEVPKALPSRMQESLELMKEHRVLIEEHLAYSFRYFPEHLTESERFVPAGGESRKSRFARAKVLSYSFGPFQQFSTVLRSRHAMPPRHCILPRQHCRLQCR